MWRHVADCSRGGYQASDMYHYRQWKAMYIESLAARTTLTGDSDSWCSSSSSSSSSSNLHGCLIVMISAITGLLGLLRGSLYISLVSYWLLAGCSQNNDTSLNWDWWLLHPVFTECSVFSVYMLHIQSHVINLQFTAVLYYTWCCWHIRDMPHSRSYSEIQPLQQPAHASYQRRASSDMTANINGIHCNRSVLYSMFSCHCHCLRLFFSRYVAVVLCLLIIAVWLHWQRHSINPLTTEPTHVPLV